MEIYEKPDIAEIDLDELNIFVGCQSYADDDDSCYSGDDDDDYSGDDDE